MSGVYDLSSTVLSAEHKSENPPLPIEISFLERYGVDRAVLASAVTYARTHGTSVDEALLGEGAVSDEVFSRALADRLGVPYYAGDSTLGEGVVPRTAILSGFAPLQADESGLRAIVAPRGGALRILVEAAEFGRPPPPIAICSRQRLGSTVRLQCGPRIADAAANDLGNTDLSLSASAGLTHGQMGVAALAAIVAAALYFEAPGWERALISTVLWIVFACGIVLRSAAVAAAESPMPATGLGEADLPVYSIIAPLHREGRVVAKLVRALDALDYPRSKLDIKLVIERGDFETLTAIAALRLPARYDVVIAPPGAPTTKPRALNVALSAARGDLIVVYDAEDEPAPDQLRLAAERFAGSPGVDALQARLTIANSGDSWLSEMFAIEYSTLFDLVNPGLAALDLPIALGGTSNHFRIQALRRVGGWDAWNVAEDADLGIRLARFGAKVAALASDTMEEAPNELGNWFRQRVRWQKGWMQTLIVHSRRPVRFIRELGALRALSATALIAGPVFSGLFGPPLLLDALWRGLHETIDPSEPISRAGDVVTYILTLAGAQTIIIPAVVATRRRRMKLGIGPWMRMPAYYVLICAATWAALFDLALRPFYWAKTEHGRVRPKAPTARPEPATNRAPSS